MAIEHVDNMASEVEAFLRERGHLQRELRDRWVVFACERFQAAFGEYETAARFAVEKFKGTPFLVRHLDVNDEQVPLVFADGDI